MPAQRGPIIRKPPKKKPARKKPYTPPATQEKFVKPPKPKPVAGPPTPKPGSRPAPKRQPGPVSEKERQKVKRHKRREAKQGERARRTLGGGLGFGIARDYKAAEARERARGMGAVRDRAAERKKERDRELRQAYARRSVALRLLKRRTTTRAEADDKSDYDRRRAPEYVRKQYQREYGDNWREIYEPGTTIPPGRTAMRRAIGRKIEEQGIEKAEAPVVKALEQTTRPLHGIAAGTRAAIKGENVPKAALRGIKNEDKSTFSDVLKDVGVPKAIAGPAGFAIDVAADPTTYVTGGAGAVGKVAAKSAAKKAAKVTPTPKRVPTTKKEMARAKERAKGGGAKSPTLSERAARRAEAKDARRGVSVRFAGREVPGVRKATAKAAEPLRRAGRTAPAQAVKRAVGEARPTLVPAGVRRAEYEEVRRAARTARAKEHGGRRKAEARARAYKKALGKKNYERVIDAIESGTIKDLPEDLRRVAKLLRDELKYTRRIARRSGVAVPELGKRRRGIGEVRREAAKEAKQAKRVETRTRTQLREAIASARVSAARSKSSASLKAAEREERRARAELGRMRRREGAQAQRVAVRRSKAEVARIRTEREFLRSDETYLKIERDLAAANAEKRRLREEVRIAEGTGKKGPVAALSAASAESRALAVKLEQRAEVLRTEPLVRTVKRGKRKGRKTLASRARILRAERREVAPRATQTKPAEAVARAKARVERAGRAVATERRRVRGVAPAQQDRLLRAIDEHDKAKAALVAARVEAKSRLPKETHVELPRKPGEPVGYVPHQRTAASLKQERKEMLAEGAGQRKVRPGSSKARAERRSLKELREQEPGKYSQDLPEIYARRMDEATTAAARADLNRRIADVGRTLKRGEDPNLRQGEAIFRIKGSDLERVTTAGPRASGRYVVLNEELIRRTVQGVARPGGGALGKGFDVATGWWKFLATVPNPGFHIRNLLGDTQNAFLAENAGRLARNIVTSGRTLRALSKAEQKKGKTLERISPTTKGTVKIKGQKVALSDLAREAESVGAIRVGFIARELPELQTALSKGAKPHKLSGRRVGRWMQNREDLLRLATYIGGRKRGLSPEKASERAAKFHFDYADLTSTERNVFRRIAPFYTFSARNIPLQFQSFFARPGKFAQYQKIREEVSKAFGLDLDKVQENLTEYEQRTAPVPIKHKGETFTVSFGASGLPLTDLNELPVSANPAKTADEWMSKALSMLNPAIKSPLEVWSNFSFFFRDQLERETGPYVAAPSLVGSLPKAVRDKLGIVDDYRDPATGEKTYGWPAKVDYFAGIMPGPAGAIERGFTKTPQSGVSKAAAYGTGLRLRKVDPTSKRIGSLFDERASVQKKLAGLRQRTRGGRRIDAENATPEYAQLLAEQRRLSAEIDRLRAKQDKVPSKKLRKPFDFSGGKGEGFDFSGGGSDEFDFD